MIRIAIAGATAGSSGFILGHDPKPWLLTSVGPTLTPLESPIDVTARNLRIIVRTLLEGADLHRNKLSGQDTHVTLSLSGTTDKVLFSVLASNIVPSKQAQTEPPVQWLTRGQAARLATGYRGNAIILKVGSLAFAHAFTTTTNWPSLEKGIRRGGWGILGPDDGGAYSTGRTLLNSAIDEIDRQLPNREHIKILKSIMEPTSTGDLLRWLQTFPCPYSLRVGVAALAPLVSYAAEQQHAAAIRILEQSARQVAMLAEQAAAAAFSQGDNIRVYLHGEMLRYSPQFQLLVIQLTRKVLSALGVTASFFSLDFSPLFGCLVNEMAEHLNDGDRAVEEIRNCDWLYHPAFYKPFPSRIAELQSQNES